MAPGRGKGSPTSKTNVPAKASKGIHTSTDEDTDEYRMKRDKNNQAVKKSRVKSRMRTQETMERVNNLKNENTMLEEKINILSKELGFLKDLFLAHAGTAPNAKLDDLDLESLLSDTNTDTLNLNANSL